MIDEIQTALTAYEDRWQTFVDGRTDKQFFGQLRMTAVGWKVADREAYDKAVAELHDQASHIVETWMNGRWIAKVLLRDRSFANGVTIIKIMQRRPGSDDALGLDHADFYSPAVSECEPILEAEKDVNWSHESNDIIEGYGWISIWFDNTEAKLKSDTVLDIVMAELQQANKQITAQDAR
jgi:hypothetical protein